MSISSEMMVFLLDSTDVFNLVNRVASEKEHYLF